MCFFKGLLLLRSLGCRERRFKGSRWLNGGGVGREALVIFVGDFIGK